MAKVKVILPAMGEGVIEATITQWLKKVGDKVEVDDPVVEIATDKVDSEIPSPVSGVLNRQLFGESDVPKVGDLIAVIETDDVTDVDPSLILTDEVRTEVSKSKKTVDTSVDLKSSSAMPEQEPIEVSLDVANVDGDLFLSPLVKSIVAKEKISPDILYKINGSGLNGRITKDDILAYLHNPQSIVPEVTEPDLLKDHTANHSSKSIAVPTLPGDEIIEMGRMRKLIADHMVNSKRISPHVTSFVEVDVTSLVNWRNKNKHTFQEKHNEKLTFTPIFIEAVAKTISDYPMINVSVSGNNIIAHKQVNIGMATALPSGNLIVPVIKQANDKSLLGLARSVNDLAQRARANKLKPDEIKGGTFTITNVGTFNNITGTPVINQPEVAILAFGAIKKKPAVIETPEGDTIGIRHIMVLAMSYDHRVVDGSLGGMFLNQVGQYLEKFDSNRTI